MNNQEDIINQPILKEWELSLREGIYSKLYKFYLINKNNFK